MKRGTLLLTILVAILAWYAWEWLQEPHVDLKDKRVVVCGASTGIGAETAVLYARLGARLVIAARRQAALEEVATRCREAGAAEVHVVAVDFADEEQCRQFIERSVQLLGGLDVLVLNHIIGYWGHWGIAGRLDTLHQLLQVNTVSHIVLATHALPHLEQAGGSVAVVSSLAGRMGLPKVAPYAASKHALHGFFESLRLELAHNNSRVSLSLCVLGNIDTPNARANTGSDVDHLPRHPADAAASAIVYGTARRHPRVFFPFAELWPTTLLHAIMPETTGRLLSWTIYRD